MTRAAEVEVLRRRLEEAEQTIKALLSGELDAVAPEPGSSPVMLKAAQEALRNSERRFAAVFEGSIEVMLLFDDDGRYVDANRAACEFLALPRDQIVGQAVGTFVDHGEELVRYARRMRELGRSEGEVKVTTSAGQRTVEYRAVANVLAGLHLIVYRDVTETRQAQAARARLAAIVESSGDAILGLTYDGHIADWNAAAERLYGYSAAEVLGRFPDFLEPPERRGEFQELWKRVTQGQHVSDLESVLRRKDGTCIDVSLTLSPIRDESGTVIGGSKVARDISDRKRAEQRFRAVLDSAPDAIVAMDAASRIALVNERAERVFGYRREELLGQPIHLLVPESLRGQHEVLVASYARTPRDLAQGREVRARRSDGSTFDAEITLSPIDEGAAGPMVIAAVRDVTDRNKIRAQLVVSDRMVSIGTLAAGVAHEINNPLAAITANLELALQEVTALGAEVGNLTELEEELRDAREAARRVRRIVGDLTIFSRSEDEQLQPVDVRRVLGSTLRMAGNEIRHRARLVEDYAPVPPVQASDSRLGQVFLNILVNAAQAIPEGHADANEIRVTVACQAGEGGAGEQVVVTISDTGQGMAPEVLNRLFTPFFTTKPVGVGTGLGLSICHRLVTSFGGHISVDSKVGEGTAFRIWLPATRAEVVASTPPVALPPPRRRGRIMVIDDEKMICQVVRRVLGSDHDVSTFTNAEEALRALQAGEPFDAILCDLMMPQMTGMDLHARLAEDHPVLATRMVFLTGGAFTPLAREFLEQNSNLRLEKPFDPHQLRTVVNDRVR